MAYTYDPIFAADPNNPATIAKDATLTIFDPADPNKAPVTIIDATGSPLANPLKVNAAGFGPAFQHASLERVGWQGAGYTGYFTSYEGMKAETTAAKNAAQDAAANAAAAATAEVEARIAAGEFQGAPGKDGANVLPTSEAIAQAVTTDGPAKTALSATYAPRGQAALLKLRGLLAQSGTAPVNIAFAGSSSVAGNNATAEAKRFVNRFSTSIQAIYPSGLGTEKAVAAWTAPTTTTAGIQVWNIGQGGTTAATYLGTAPSSWQYLKFADVKPVAIFHMVGSNDWALDVAPATYKANLQASIAAIDAQFTAPHVHVLLHAFRRTGGIDGPYEWSQYKQAMQEIAAADPADVLFFDLEAVGEANDLSGGDPLNLLDTDNVHPTDAGHALINYTLLTVLELPPATSATAAAVAPVAMVRTRLTSDKFTGSAAADINGRASDAGLGGVGNTWIAEPASNVATNGSAMVRGAGTAAAFAAMLPETNMNMEISFTITASPSGGGMFCELHRQSASATPTANAYRLEFQSGVMFLKKWVGGNTTFGSSSTYAVGDRIALRYFNGKLELRKNDLLINSVADTSITTVGYCGFTGAAATVNYGIDDVMVDALS